MGVKEMVKLFEGWRNGQGVQEDLRDGGEVFRFGEQSVESPDKRRRISPSLSSQHALTRPTPIPWTKLTPTSSTTPPCTSSWSGPGTWRRRSHAPLAPPTADIRKVEEVDHLGGEAVRMASRRTPWTPKRVPTQPESTSYARGSSSTLSQINGNNLVRLHTTKLGITVAGRANIRQEKLPEAGTMSKLGSTSTSLDAKNQPYPPYHHHLHRALNSAHLHRTGNKYKTGLHCPEYMEQLAITLALAYQGEVLEGVVLPAIFFIIISARRNRNYQNRMAAQPCSSGPPPPTRFWMFLKRKIL